MTFLFGCFAKRRSRLGFPHIKVKSFQNLLCEILQTDRSLALLHQVLKRNRTNVGQRQLLNKRVNFGRIHKAWILFGVFENRGLGRERKCILADLVWLGSRGFTYIKSRQIAQATVHAAIRLRKQNFIVRQFDFSAFVLLAMGVELAGGLEHRITT